MGTLASPHGLDGSYGTRSLTCPIVHVICPEVLANPGTETKVSQSEFLVKSSTKQREVSMTSDLSPYIPGRLGCS